MLRRYGTKNGAAYSASKWGITGLMKSAALQLGKHKISVNAIEPGRTVAETGTGAPVAVVLATDAAGKVTGAG